MRGQEQRRAESIRSFVDGKAGPVRSELAERTARLAYIEREEIFPVMRIGGAGVLLLEIGSHRKHGRLIRGAEGDVVDRAGAGAALQKPPASRTSITSPDEEVRRRMLSVAPVSV